jgi:hypothetical protein
MASATAQQIIERAAGIINVLAASEALNANEMTDSLQIMNDMMFGFPARGIQYVHTQLAQGDTVNVPDGYIRAVTLLLADDLADNFGMPISPDLRNDVMRAEQQLQAFYFVSTPAKIGRGLLRWRYGLFNMNKGF